MKLGIMQPYFFPYIGYWQLMNAVDTYVIYDDVNYINRGWINRNRILINGAPAYINLSLLGASQNKLINEISVNPDSKLIEKNLKTLRQAYAKAPYFSAVMPLLEKVLTCGKTNTAEYIQYSFQTVCAYLGIQTRFLLSSQLDKDCSLKGQDKILAICRLLGATDYYNAIGGKELYDYPTFADAGIALHFLRTDEITYRQFGDHFEPWLSIIDVMMFNSVEEIQEMLNKYTLE